jgi:sulfide dehydrogenase cytochrome subunit
MNCFTNYGRAILLTSALGVPGLAFAGDLDELTAQCDGCHGPHGASSFSDMPIIGGQSAEYFSDSLKSFQDWGRPCVKSRYRYGDTSRPRTDMCKITAGLSNEDFAALTAHYTALPFVSAKQEFDATQVEAGATLQAEHCETCHQQGGKSLEGRGPRLAGQWTPYLKATLKYVPTGEHLVPHAMETLLTDLTNEDLDAILSFYASQQN